MDETRAQENQEIFEIIRDNVAQGNLVYETPDGLFSCPIGDFATKDPQEILDLLQMGLQNIFDRVQIGDDSRFVNDMAIANLLCHFRENWRPK